MKFGRFAIYFENNEFEELKKCKVDVVLKILGNFLKGFDGSILEIPGSLRIIGPIKGRVGVGLILSSPFPPVFELSIMAFKSSLNHSLGFWKPRWIVRIEEANLKNMATPGDIIMRTKSPILNIGNLEDRLKELAEKAKSFLGLRPRKLNYEIHAVNMNFSKCEFGCLGRGEILFKAHDEYSSFIISYARYAGIGEKLLEGFGDVELLRL